MNYNKLKSSLKGASKVPPSVIFKYFIYILLAFLAVTFYKRILHFIEDLFGDDDAKKNGDDAKNYIDNLKKFDKDAAQGTNISQAEAKEYAEALYKILNNKIVNSTALKAMLNKKSGYSYTFFGNNVRLIIHAYGSRKLSGTLWGENGPYDLTKSFQDKISMWEFDLKATLNEMYNSANLPDIF